jgi:ketosteroid isomerase-like protein
MRKLKPFILIIAVIATGIFTACNPQKPFGETEEQAMRDTITGLMNRIFSSAEKANADSVFAFHQSDTILQYFSGGVSVSADGLKTMFRDIYKNIKSQHFSALKQKVLVFPPVAAVWLGIMKNDYETTGGEKQREFLTETWIWHRGPDGWKVVHSHESWLALPGENLRLQVEKSLGELAQTFGKKLPAPDRVPGALKEFLKKNPMVYGSTFAYPASPGNKHEPVAYVYRSGSEFRQVNIPPDADYSVSEWYAGAVASKTPRWSDPYYDSGIGSVIMTTYSIPLYDAQGGLLGVLTADLELRQ